MSNWSTFSYLCQRLLISINFIIFNVGQFTLLLLTCFNYHIHQLSLNFVNYRQLLSIFDPFWRSYFQLQWEDSRDGHGQMLFHYNHENWRLWTIKEILPTRPLVKLYAKNFSHSLKCCNWQRTINYFIAAFLILTLCIAFQCIIQIKIMHRFEWFFDNCLISDFHFSELVEEFLFDVLIWTPFYRSIYLRSNTKKIKCFKLRFFFALFWIQSALQ